MIGKLKIFALNWAINRCRLQLGQAPQQLPIKVTNKHLAPNECGLDEKKIVIGNNEISVYEHYVEPGNPFLRHGYGDFRYFMRTWLQPVISRAADDFLITIPEYKKSHEKAKAAYDWMPYFRLTFKDRIIVENAFRGNLEKLLVAFPMRLVNILLFGRYNYSFKALSQELIGEWVSGNAKLRYVFREDGFTRYENDQPLECSYQIRTIGSRHLSLDTIFLPRKIPDSMTLYFFDDGKTIECCGSSSTILLRS